MNLFFGNRGAWLRVGLAVAGLVGVTVYLELAWELPDPDVRDCLRDPARYDGCTVWLGPARIVRLDTDGFYVESVRDEATVKAPAGLVTEGDQIVFRGTFRRDGVVELDREPDGRWALRPSPAGQEKRIGMAVLSCAVLAYLGWRFFRTFGVERGQVTLKSR